MAEGEDDQLQFIFDIIDSLSTPTQQMAKSLAMVTAQLGTIDASLRKMQDRVQETGHKTDEATGHLKELGEAAHEASEGIEGLFTLEQLEVGAKIIEHTTDVVKELVGEIIHASAAAEKLDLAISSSAGAGGAEGINEYIEKIEKNTAFDDDELKRAVLPLLNLGMGPGPELEKAMAAALSYSTRTNSGIAGVEGMLSMLARVQSMGVVSARMLPAFGVKKTDFETELAKVLGTDVKSAMKRMEEGKVKTETLMSVIYKAMQSRESSGMVGGAGVDAASTLDAQLRRLKNVPENIFKTFRSTDGYKELKGAMANALEGILDEGTWTRATTAVAALGTKIFKALNSEEGRAIFQKGLNIILSVLEALPGVIDKVTTALKILWPVARIAGEFFIAFKVISAAYAVAMGVMFVATGGLTAALGQLAIAILANPVGFLIGLVAALAVGAYELIKHWSQVTAFFKRIWTFLMGVFQEGIAFFRDIGGRIIDGLIEGIKAAWAKGKAEVKQVWTDLKTGITDMLGIHSPSAVFAGYGGNVAAGFVSGIQGSQDAIAEAMEDTFGVTPETSLALPGARPGAGRTVQLRVDLGGVHVHLSGADGADADALADQMARRLRPEIDAAMLAAIDALNAEAGTDDG